jgi:hypothetical protein
MGSTAPSISWRTLCAQHLSHLVETLERQVEAEVQARVSAAVDDALETAVSSAINRSRRELSEQLNQAVRQLRLCMAAAEIPWALADAAAPFAQRVAVFTIQDKIARASRPPGNYKTAKPAGAFEVPLDEAPALRAAVESRDPVVALATGGEVSARLLEALGPGDGDKVYLFPIVAGKQVVAMLCAAGALHAAALELLTGVAALYWESLGTARPQPAGLLTISGTMWKQPSPSASSVSADKKPGGKWWELTPHERQLHLAAQRFARLHVAEMRLYRIDAVRSGRARLDLYDALRDSIDTAREGFRQKFIGASPTMVDYLHLELLRSLADDDPHLLGHEYPGPLA